MFKILFHWFKINTVGANHSSLWFKGLLNAERLVNEGYEVDGVWLCRKTGHAWHYTSIALLNDEESEGTLDYLRLKGLI